MWLFFLMWCAIIASVPVHHNTMEAFASTIKRLPDIFWNTSNPIFRIDNTDHIIDVNQEDTGNPFDYDQINIICPVYDPTIVPNMRDTEQFVIYHVTKEEYDTCIIRSQRPRIIAQCNSPYKLEVITISFRSFNPMPYSLEYKPGKDYHFISTSSKDDLKLRIGGMCLSNNMKIVFKVGTRHQIKSALSDSNSGKIKNTESLVNQLSNRATSDGNGIQAPEENVLPNGINRKRTTPKGRNKNKKHRKRRKNRERTEKLNKKGDRRRKNNKNQNTNQENNDISDPDGSMDSCPPGGCSSNLFENRNNDDYNTNNKFRIDKYNRQSYITGNEETRFGDMPSKDEKLLKDKTPRILQDERSNVAIVHDLMSKQEPSISASGSSATCLHSFFIPKLLATMFTFPMYTYFSHFLSH